MALDMKQRSRLARVDDQSTRDKIELARKIIYEKNFAIDTDAVEELLKDKSLTPILVRLERFGIGPPTYPITTIECICKEIRPTWCKPLPATCC